MHEAVRAEIRRVLLNPDRMPAVLSLLIARLREEHGTDMTTLATGVMYYLMLHALRQGGSGARALDLDRAAERIARLSVGDLVP